MYHYVIILGLFRTMPRLCAALVGFLILAPIRSFSSILARRPVPLVTLRLRDP